MRIKFYISELFGGTEKRLTRKYIDQINEDAKK